MANALDTFHLAAPIFIDANIFLFHAFAHPQHGDAARRFLERVDLGCQLGLLITDATHVATWQAQGIVHVATDDEDLWRVPGVTVWGP